MVEQSRLRLGEGKPRRLPFSVGRRSVVQDVVNEDLGSCLASSGNTDIDFDNSRQGMHVDRSRDVTLLDDDAMGAWNA